MSAYSPKGRNLQGEWGDSAGVKLLMGMALAMAGITGSAAAHGAGLCVATFNVQALSGRDSDARFQVVAESLRAVGFPEAVALQEVGDDDGALDRGETSARLTLQRLRARIEAAGGPHYEVIEVAPEDGRSGGPPGLNIRNVILTTLPFVHRPGAKLVDVKVNQVSGLSPNPGVLGRNEPAHADSRLPLVAELWWQGIPLVLVNVHLRAGLARAETRAAQAHGLVRFADELRRAWPAAPLLVLGDFNVFEGEGLPLAHAGLSDAHEARAAPTHASGQRFDRIFHDGPWAASAGGVLPPSAASDHALVWVRFEPLPPGTAAGCSVCRASERPAAGPWLVALVSGLVRRRRRSARDAAVVGGKALWEDGRACQWAREAKPESEAHASRISSHRNGRNVVVRRPVGRLRR